MGWGWRRSDLPRTWGYEEGLGPRDEGWAAPAVRCLLSTFQLAQPRFKL